LYMIFSCEFIFTMQRKVTKGPNVLHQKVDLLHLSHFIS
jgi:hypothetical protein